MTDVKTDKNDLLPTEELDTLVRDTWQPALRMTLDSEGAPGRCKRRACRLAGECRMVMKEGGALDCGGGITDQTLKTACVATLFASLMTHRLAGGCVVADR